MKKTLLIIAALFISGTLNTFAQELAEMKYRRSSIYSLMIKHEKQKYADTISNVFLVMPVPDKYNDHDLSVKIISVDQKKKAKPDEIATFLNNNGVASRLVSKWFDRDFVSGTCNIDIIKERGLYNASEMDKAIASQSIRGTAMLEDAGEELIGNTFVLVNDIRYIDKEKRSKVVGALFKAADVALGGNTGLDDIGDIAESWKGFRVKILTHLYQLVWDEETANEFYTELYSDEPDATKVALMESNRNKFKLKYLGTQESSGSTTSFMGVKLDTPEMMVRKACQRALDENVANLQKNFDAFKVKVPLLSSEPIKAQIGKKEGITSKSKFEVLEAEEKDGRTVYKRVGVISPLPNLIWDNRYMAVEERAIGATLGATTFKKVSGGDFYPGMLIREIK